MEYAFIMTLRTIFKLANNLMLTGRIFFNSLSAFITILLYDYCPYHVVFDYLSCRFPHAIQNLEFFSSLDAKGSTLECFF